MRSYVQQASAEQLAAEMGPGAASIAEIVPEIHHKITDLKTSPALEPEAARFRLFDTITTSLKNAAQNQPLLLVLDDLHWADQSSLKLLEFLARELAESRLLLVGCYRDTDLSRQHPLSETLAQLSRSAEGGLRRQVLRGLAQDELGQFIEATTGVQLTQELSGAIYSHTEGNTFFMTEVIRLLSESGELTAEHAGTPEGLRIPQGVREVIGQRLNRLSEQCNDVLTTASILGREFDFKLLVSLKEEGAEDRVLEAVEEALAAHVIEEPPGTMDRYQFSHALIQETLAQELSTTRRIRLHARIAEGLEELYGEDAETHAAELAHHFAEAQTSTGITELVRYSLLAGERALAIYAYQEALAHFEKGLVTRTIAPSAKEPASGEEAAALLFGPARAKSATGEWHQLAEAFAAISRAFEFYAQGGYVAQAVAAAELPFATSTILIPGIAELIARALTLVPADSHEPGRLLSRYGGIIGAAESDYEGAQQALGRAVAIARREGDVPLEVQTLTYAANVDGQHHHWRKSVASGLRAIELATGDENTFSEVDSRYWAAMGLLYMGDLDAVRSHALVLRDLAERPSTPRQLASRGLVPITCLSCLEGDWKAGREYSDRALEVSPLYSQPLLLRVFLEHETGDSTQGEVYLELLLEAMRQEGLDYLQTSARTSLTIAAIARITGIPKRLEIAEAAAEAVLSAQSITPNRKTYAKAGLALLAAQEGDRSAAKDHHAYFLGYRSTMVGMLSSVDRLLGLMSHTIGNLDQAAEHFDDALAFCRKAGYRPELAWSCCDYADLLMVGAGLKPAPTQWGIAMALLEESLSIATELGMRPLMERANERLERAHAQPNVAPAYPGGLTEREVEVLRLIASGKTNLEIAQELVIAEGTARRHVANIYEKIGAANRVEAASYAAQHGLLDSS